MHGQERAWHSGSRFPAHQARPQRTFLSHPCEPPPPGACVSSTPRTLQSLRDVCLEFLITGSIYRTPTATNDASSGGGSAGGSSTTPTDGWAVNPTLLHPGSRAWLVHYGALPFLSFLPLDRRAMLASPPPPRRAPSRRPACLTWQCCYEAGRPAAKGATWRCGCGATTRWRCAGAGLAPARQAAQQAGQRAAMLRHGLMPSTPPTCQV